MSNTHPLQSHPTTSLLTWQPEKRLRSGSRVWILTDVQSYDFCFYDWSVPQESFRVGVYDLETKKIGWANFGRDIAYAMVKAGVQPPPWKEPMPFGIELHRDPHANGEEKGRFTGWVDLIILDPELLAIVPIAMKKFADHRPNSTPGMWDDFGARAAEERAIELAALGMVGPFSAGDLRRKLEDPKAKVTPVLQRLVREGKLLSSGKKRGTRYWVTPPTLVQRVDWTD
jgi:hypothetical protein